MSGPLPTACAAASRALGHTSSGGASALIGLAEKASASPDHASEYSGSSSVASAIALLNSRWNSSMLLGSLSKDADQVCTWSRTRINFDVTRHRFPSARIEPSITYVAPSLRPISASDFVVRL